MGRLRKEEEMRERTEQEGKPRGASSASKKTSPGLSHLL